MPKPKHIILIRHGESQANVSTDILHEIPDYKIELSERGKEQARTAGQQLKELIGDANVLFYVSPYKRTFQTYEGLVQAFNPAQVKYYMEPRLREQDFGNFQDAKKMKQALKLRSDYGRFFYRFPEGESGADVYDRISSFLESLYRYFERGEEQHVVIVSHGLTVRLFLMRWFHWTVEEFESFDNPRNYVMELGGDNRNLKYHLKTELRKSKKEKEDQKNRWRLSHSIPPLVLFGIGLALLRYWHKVLG